MRAIAVLGVLLIATSCAAEPAPRAPELPPLPAGARPFELFRRADLTLVDQADRALFLECLADNGYPQERALGNESVEAVTGLSRPPISPRTEAEARKYGFGTALPAEPATIDRKDPAFFAVADRCETTAREALGVPIEVAGLRDRYAQLGNALVQDRARKVEAILVAYGKKLVACLAGRGHRLQAGATFSARGDLKQFGITTGSHAPAKPTPVRRPAGLPADVPYKPAVPPREYRPSKAEAAFAVSFVRCGQQTGLFAAIDRDGLAIEQQIVERHVSEFSGLNPQIEALAAKSSEVLRGR
ncbi:hypothetical protein GCM10029976_050460 [Kribbella albertanoniae]|uniref:Uncharacterized protein n=1 Tax=Kribbella albertanoniae TaxID=1266829 RepID=A0A4R4Q5I9_9ACTN|nr:hypothetical protein [Kribbella albertanoniae]TDC30133.1 hypothetical protein E1261_14210 [Kribbella albertanoniae]